MNANAIYSKSGKGVQEASGKTSHLSRPDRSVLSAIDGRATLAEVAQKVGKTFDPAFEKLIETLDKGGFVREVSPGTAAPAKPGAGAKPGGKPGASAPMDAVSDLDFTAAMSAPKSKAPPPPQAPPRATPPPARHSATIPPPPPPPSAAEKAQAAKSAKEQQDAFARARQEAEEKAAAERERAKAEAEAKIRAETEAKLRAESTDAQKKLAEADAKIKAAHDAAAKVATEAKARAEAEAKKAREEADRARKETEEKARREREELNRKLEEERKAREEAERRAKEEAKRLEEERRKLEEERKREEAERAARRKREEEEAEERRRKRAEEEERERAEREAKREAERAERQRQEQEEEEREKAQKAMRDARRKAEQKKEEEEEEKRRAERKKRDPDEPGEEPQEEKRPAAKPKKAPEPEPAAPAGGGLSDSLLADLDSFTNREEEDRKAQEEEERKKKEEATRRAREAEERRTKEEAEREEREEKERRKREEKERKAREEAELRERDEKEKQRLKDEEEKRKKEAEEREKKSKQDERLTANATRGATAYDADAERRSKRERELGPKPRTAAAAAAEMGKKGGLGKPIALGLLGLVVVAAGIAHVMPIDTADYERAATEALGRQVKIGSARLSLFSGLQLKFSGVAVGDDVKIAEVRGYPAIGALTGPKKDFSRIEIDGAKIDQRAVGAALFLKVKADNFSVGRIVAKQIEFPGPLALPKGLDLEINYDAEGAVQSAVVRGPEALVARLAPKGSSIEVDLSASSFTLPFAPEITLAKFALKGSATPRGLAVSEWDGSAYSGTLAGTANLVWGDTWVVDGVVTARNLNAAVFAPALLSEGKGDGSGKFSMRGQPGKLAAGARIDGNFTVSRGVLGTIDLSRAIQTSGKQATGRTQFNEMNGQGVYDRGAVALRNVILSAGQLNAGASVDIAQSGALSGRIVADVRVASQNLRATLNLGGNIKEPQVRN